MISILDDDDKKSPQLIRRVKEGLNALGDLADGGFVVVTTGAQVGGLVLAMRPDLVCEGLRLRQKNTPTIETCFLQHEDAKSFYEQPKVMTFLASVFAAYVVHKQHKVVLMVPQAEVPYSPAYKSTTLGLFVKAYMEYWGEVDSITVYGYYCYGIDPAAPDVPVAQKVLSGGTRDIIALASGEELVDTVRYCLRRSAPPEETDMWQVLEHREFNAYNRDNAIKRGRGLCGMHVQSPDHRWFSLYCARPGLYEGHAFTVSQTYRLLTCADPCSFQFSTTVDKWLICIHEIAYALKFNGDAAILRHVWLTCGG